MTRDRYDGYADTFDNPVTAESIELGDRILHWTFAEWWYPRGVIDQHAREAQARTREAAGDADGLG